MKNEKSKYAMRESCMFEWGQSGFVMCGQCTASVGCGETCAYMVVKVMHMLESFMRGVSIGVEPEQCVKTCSLFTHIWTTIWHVRAYDSTLCPTNTSTQHHTDTHVEQMHSTRAK